MTPDEFIRKMLVLYGAPDTADDQVFIDEYRAMMGTPNPRVLAVAFSIIRDEHEFKAWPMPAVVRKAISSADLRVNGPYRPSEPTQQNPRANPSPESRARVDAIVSNALQAMVQEQEVGKPKFPFAAVQRSSFEAMRQNSPNKFMHVKPAR